MQREQVGEREKQTATKSKNIYLNLIKEMAIERAERAKAEAYFSHSVP